MVSDDTHIPPGADSDECNRCGNLSKVIKTESQRSKAEFTAAVILKLPIKLSVNRNWGDIVDWLINLLEQVINLSLKDFGLLWQLHLLSLNIGVEIALKSFHAAL